MVPSKTDTLVIGAGQAGLAMSHYLTQGGRDHVVLERRETLGGGWQDRWDAFRLVTPNWSSALPGLPYDGDDPDAFMPRDEIVARIARYADAVAAPVALGTEVVRLEHDGEGFRAQTSQGEIRARSAVVATGNFGVPRLPELAHALPGRLFQVHSHAYRNERQLPAGAVLVVGSAQSGVQLTEELRDAGRAVYLSVGTAGWIPRRYRGRDVFHWFHGLATEGAALGIPFPTAETLPDPRIRLAGNPQLSGHGGGHDVDLRRLASEGVTLLGRISAVEGQRLVLAPGLTATLAGIDASFAARYQPLFDRYIAATGADAPLDHGERSTFEPPELDVLDLASAGVSSVIWATGYRPEFGWIDPPIVDEMGLPRHRRGVSEIPGLFFLGLLWQHTQASATLFGPTIDGPHVVRAMGVAIGEDRVPAGAAGAAGVG